MGFRHGERRLRRPAVTVSVTTVCLATAMAATMLTGQAVARTAAPQAEFGTVKSTTHDITLITGDRVHVTVSADRRSTATVTPAPRAKGVLPAGFHVQERDGQVYVYPGDMLDLIPERLDPELFNVTALAEQGQADTTARSIPLILTYREHATKAAIPQVEQVRALESLNGAGVSLAKDQAAQFGGALSRLAAAPRTKAASPLDGVAKIWLDRKVESVLDRSVPQINAPAAWQAGFDGAGTTVAILDSGIDTSHPDLAGRVTAERDFSDEGSTKDLNGHGTHVAATVGGAGERKGVAPGARIVNGRVLNADGIGLSSWAIDGMEWAAGEAGADIVNLSLGSSQPGGPLTDAIGALTERHGTLFVVAAGNYGCAACIGSPGDSPAALTVGAVDSEDRMAEFSNYGPVGLDRLIKPDVTAPGVGIVAARAHGTALGEPVDDSYTRMSGTSMAAPHVAGAAALLRQARPGIKAAELKSLLMGTAKPTADVPPDRQGAGRVDVAAALAGPVVASSGSLGFGLMVTTDGEPVTRKVTYRNPGSAQAVLDLTAGGAFTVTPAELSLPPGGEAQVTVTLDPAKVTAGPQRAELVATSRAGGTLRVLLTGNAEPKRVRLRMTPIARDGRATRAVTNVVNLADGGLDGKAMPHDPVQHCPGDQAGECLLVLPGTYSVLGRVETMHPSKDPYNSDRGSVLHGSLVGDPEVEVTGDTEIVLDARKATEVLITTPDHRTHRNPGAASKLSWHRSPEKGPDSADFYLSLGGNLEERIFIQPTERVTKGEFGVASRWRLEAPEITMKTQGIELRPEYYDPVWFSDDSSQYPRLDGTSTLLAADARRAEAKDLAGVNLRGRLALIRRDPRVTVAAQANAAAAAGAKMVAVYSDTPGIDGVFPGTGEKLSVPTVRLTYEEGRQLLDRMSRRPVTITATGVVASPYVYDLYPREEGRVPRNLEYLARAGSMARVDTTFRTQQTGNTVIAETRTGRQSWEDAAYDAQHPVRRTPLTRAEYITADPGVEWSAAVITPEPYYNAQWQPPEISRTLLAETDNRSYRPGERTTRDWLKQPILPGVPPNDPIRRQGDLISVNLQGFADAHGNMGPAWTEPFENGTKTDFRLYQGDTLLAGTTQAAVGTIAIPEVAATYRMEYDLEMRAPWARLSTRTRSVWTFGSQRPGGAATTVLPLLFADYDIPSDLRNRSDSGKLGLRVYHQKGAATSAIKDVSLEVSYDDGATWRAAERLRAKGGNAYEATLGRGTGDHVSLRVKAADHRGGTLTQEVIRAYARR
ncbi:S8 family peptidase [Nonomuraea jiangxiensis]|uniref:PA domain-containing protein n=1 Tax=Nonomuraea jiangxiensis TaxID=633440 RepID=A0A1G8S323_9ACTN|nr:S8 family serine peptidase [Nonomuraea jiangxiensis]SDJ23060.1 PA domain-containing protein [Nonomuraea jiangxiensis]